MRLEILALVGLLSTLGAVGSAEVATSSSYQYYQGYTPEAPQQDWQKCLAEICGSNLNLRQTQTMQYYSGTEGKTLMTRNLPLIADMQRIYQAELRGYLRANELLLESWNMNLKVTDPHVLQISRGFELGSFLNESAKWNEKGLDEATTRASLRDKGVTDREIAGLMSLLKELAKPKAQADYPFLEDEFDFAVQSQSPQEIARQLKAATKEIEQRQNKVSKVLSSSDPSFKQRLIERQRLYARVRSGVWNRRDIETVSADLKDARFTGMLVDLAKSSEVPGFHAQDIVSKEVIESLRERTAVMRNALSKNPDPSNPAVIELNDQITNCMSIMAEAESLLPNEEQLKKFAESETALRKRFVQSLGARFSEESRKRIESAMEKTLIKSPVSLSEWRKGLSRSVQEYLALYKEGEAKPLSHDKRAQHAVANARQLKSPETVSLNKPYSETLKGICAAAKVEPIPDKAHFLDGRAQFGPLTARQGETGEMVCKHEYGHLITGEFMKKNVSDESRKKYDEIRACLQKPYGSNTHYVEEDWADAVALSHQPMHQQSSLFCHFINGHEKGFFTLKNWNTEDTHSSPLYRILHHRVYNGGVPEICTKALKDQGEEFTLTKCL